MRGGIVGVVLICAALLMKFERTEDIDSMWSSPSIGSARPGFQPLQGVSIRNRLDGGA